MDKAGKDKLQITQLTQEIDVLHREIAKLKSNSMNVNQSETIEPESSIVEDEIAAGAEKSVAQGNKAVLQACDALNEAQEYQVMIENWTRETLISKYEVLRANNRILQKRIMQLASPWDKSEYPDIEDIRGLFDTLRKQYFTDVCFVQYISCTLYIR